MGADHLTFLLDKAPLRERTGSYNGVSLFRKAQVALLT